LLLKRNTGPDGALAARSCARKKHLALTGSNRSTVGAKQPEETGLCDGKIKKHSDWASVGIKTESSGGKENLP
jgi:hypothetical protein